jgi:hypothetical protein
MYAALRRTSKTCLWLLLSLLLGFFSCTALPALASPLEVSVNPLRIEFTASPGETLKGTLRFWNGTDGELPVHLEAVDVSQQDEEGHAAVAEEHAANSLKAWVTPIYPDLVIFPKQEIPFDFTIEVPPNADPGTHWGEILVITTPPNQANGAAAQVGIGVILLVRVLGEATEKLELESVSAPRFTEAPPIALEARFRNDGNVHEAPLGDIEVRNMFGGLVATGTLPVRNVLPGVVRKVEASVGDGLWFGRYTVLLHATYGDDGQELGSKQYVWVLPWRTQGWKFLLGIGVLTFVIWKRRNFGMAWYFLKTAHPPPQDL